MQLAGHDHLRKLGVTLVPATAPDFFTKDTPTAVLVRQVLGAIAQFDKATTIAKLKAARDRKKPPGRSAAAVKAMPSETRGRSGTVAPAQRRWTYPLRQVAAELAEYGFRGPSGQPYAAAAVASMLGAA